MTQQEWLMQQQGLLGGARPIPGMFSNAQMMGGARGGGGGMPMGMSSTTTGEDPLGPPPEDPMTTAMKMHYMYEGGQKGKEYIGDAWKKGKEWFEEFNPVESIKQLDFGGSPTQQTTKFVTEPIPQAPSVGANVQSTGARQLFGPQASVGETPIDMGVWGDTYAAHPMDTSSPGGLIDTSGDWMNPGVGMEGYKAGGVADFGNIPADPLISGTQSLDYAGLYPQPELSGLSNMPGSAGSAGLFTPGAGALNASTGVFTPAGGQLMGDAVGAGSKFAGGGFSNVPKGAGGSALGALGSAAGVGLNIYDMTQQGVTPGNMLGLGGSALLGANALGFGLANAWNPLGWAMLGTSIAGSLFDWW